MSALPVPGHAGPRLSAYAPQRSDDVSLHELRNAVQLIQQHGLSTVAFDADANRVVLAWNL